VSDDGKRKRKGRPAKGDVASDVATEGGCCLIEAVTAIAFLLLVPTIMLLR